MRIHVFPELLELAPGEPAALQVDVYNDRDIIDGFTVSLVGLGAQQLTVEPRELSLFPETEGSVTVMFTPPADFPAGRRLAGVRVSSTTTPGLSETANLQIDVAARASATFDVEPQTVTGGKKAEYGVVLENRGNTPLSISLAGSDPEHAMHVQCTPARIDVAPGGRKIARARVEGKRPLMGTPVARILTFRAEGSPGNQEYMTTFIQRPLLSRGVLTFAGLLAAVTVWALVLFAGLNRVAGNTDMKTRAEATETALEKAVAANGGDGGGGDAGKDGGAGKAGGAAIAGAGQGRITGTLMSVGATPAGVEGGVVEAHPTDVPEQVAALATTDNSGAFTLAGLPPGSYALKGSAPGYTATWYPRGSGIDQATPVMVGPDVPAPAIVFSLAGKPGAIAGAVRDASGPVEGVSVSAAGGTAPAQAVTGADGSYLLSNLATPGTYSLTLSRTGFTTQTLSVPLTAGQSLMGKDILLTSGAGAISGKVLDQADAPLGGATIAVTDETGGQVATATTLESGAVGTFVARGLSAPATYTVTASKEKYFGTPQTVTLESVDKPQTVTLKLTAGAASVSGKIGTDAITGPCAGDGAFTTPCRLNNVKVTFTDPNGVKVPTTSAGGGVYRANLRPATYTITYELARYQVLTEDLDVSAAGARTTRDVKLAGVLGTIRGTLTTCGNAPVVRAYAPDGRDLKLEAPGSEGEYVITNVPTPGVYDVAVYESADKRSRSRVTSVDPGGSSTRDFNCVIGDAPQSSVIPNGLRADADRPRRHPRIRRR